MAAPATAPDGVRMDDAATTSAVTRYYGEVLATSADLKTTACCAAGSPPAHIRNILKHLPEEVIAKFYGCGAPLPLGMEGRRVLDLGRRVRRASKKVSPRPLTRGPRRAAAPGATATWRRRWWAPAVA